MYRNLTVLLSLFLLVNGLDLECSVETIERLFASASDDRKCELCEILKSKLEITHCQTNLHSSPCIANPHLLPPPPHQAPNTTTNNNNHDDPFLQQSIHWDKITLNTNNNEQSIFRAVIKRSSNKDDQEQSPPDEFLSITFPEYPKILPRICAQRKHPVQSPFGHECSPNAKCVENESSVDGYVCECKDQCSKTWLLRKILEWIQIVCIVICVLLCLVVYWLRKSKVMTVAMWPITESILFGSILLYTSVILKIEIPTNTAMLCLIEPWAREIGFALVYGGIILKIYRSLVEFRTRKAHRWVVRGRDLIRYLITMIAIVVFYMTSWTVTNKYYDEESQGEDFYDHLYCPITWWHRVTEFGEVLFLCVGLNMAWHLRRAPPSPFKNFDHSALLIEITTNVLGIILRESRHVLVDEDEVFLMLLHVVRCQITTTLILFLVIAPKFYYIRDEKRKRQLRRGDTTSSGLGAGRKALEAAINNGDLDFADVALCDMDPQDIRLELKRVYTQLELLRNKTMRKDNPHISKRRGGRKPTHRRFSLQKKGSRDKALRRQQQQQQQHQHYHQQPPQRSFRSYTADEEDSVCSIEGPSFSEVGR